MKRKAARGGVIWLVILTASVSADDGRPVREARSENERFVLRIDPGRPGKSARSACQAVLATGKSGNQRSIQWERPLVNDVAPEHAFVRDDGQIVVTLDEFRRGGARHALVIYGGDGRLMRHFLLPDLLAAEDWKHVKLDRGRITWLEDARFAFSPAPPEFVITTAWKREIHIDLENFSVLRDEDEAGVVQSVPEEFLLALYGNEEAILREAALDRLVEKTGLDRETLTRLIKLGYIKLSDADADAETPAETEEATPQELAADQPPESVAEELAGQEQVSQERAAAEPVASDAAPSDEPAETAIAPYDATGELRAPQPNPSEPVDYLAWVNSTTRTESPNAGPVYRAAIENLTEFTGDPQLLRSAAAGDAEALQSPAVQAWLAENREAMESFRDATTYAFRGFELHSEDGSLLGALLPNLAPLRQLGRATIAEGRLRAAEGRTDEALGYYLDTLAAGAQTGNGPTLIENLVGIAMQQPAAEAVLDLAASPAAREVDFEAVAYELEEIYQPTRPMTETLEFERASVLDTLQRLYQPDPETGGTVLDPAKATEFVNLLGELSSDDQKPDPQELVSRLATQSFDRTIGEINAYYDALSEATALPYPESRRMLGEVEAVLESEDASPVLRSLAPSLTRAKFAQTRAETQRRATLLVSNLTAYRQQYGTYPESLDVFSDSTYVVDPFTNQRFAYQRNGDDYVLYSLGNNGVDDGGAHDPRAESADVLFWPRPPREQDP